MAADRIGRIEVEFFARIGEGEPIDLGIGYLPITLRAMQNGHLDVDLTGPFEVLRATLQRIYNPEEESA